MIHEPSTGCFSHFKLLKDHITAAPEWAKSGSALCFSFVLLQNEEGDRPQFSGLFPIMDLVKDGQVLATMATISGCQSARKLKFGQGLLWLWGQEICHVSKNCRNPPTNFDGSCDQSGVGRLLSTKEMFVLNVSRVQLESSMNGDTLKQMRLMTENPIQKWMIYGYPYDLGNLPLNIMFSALNPINHPFQWDFLCKPSIVSVCCSVWLWLANGNVITSPLVPMWLGSSFE